MPTLIIDTITVEVPEGTNILEAARSVGITIPHFCWHPALGKAGACRVCAVRIVEGPAKGIQMSCMLPVQDGMVVSTTDAEARQLRRSVIEWLMINHPHDCPVCDEGGECQLQDFTVAGGHGIRRYDGPKRTHTNQYLGEQVEHEMNRCIQCYRCVRFYQEYAGGTDFGVMGRSGSVYFGRQQDGALESPFSGNLVDICPTGVFTDKTARFRARYWDYDMADSICPGCSLGCNTIPMARYRELLKVKARRNDTVNGYFICDRGRFSSAAVNAADRPRQALIDGRAVPLVAALDAAAERIREHIEQYGAESLAIVGSPRLCYEGNLMATILKKTLGAGALCFYHDGIHADLMHKAVEMLSGGRSASQDDIRQADLVAIAGCDLLNEGPMLALAVRQAWRNGARVYLVGDMVETAESDRPLFESIAVARLSDVPFNGAQRAVVICGLDRSRLSELCDIQSGNVKAVVAMRHANDFGCALLTEEYGAVSLTEALDSGKIKGIIAFEAVLPIAIPEDVRVIAASDWLPTPQLARAEIVLPSCAWVEHDGSYINNEGRKQTFRRVMVPGLPVKGLTVEQHPPREHRHTAPGGDVLPTRVLIEKLLERLGDQKNVPFNPDNHGSFVNTPHSG